MSELIGAAMQLAGRIIELASQGLSDEEIRERLADPDDVAADLLRRVRERATMGRKLLGRDPR